MEPEGSTTLMSVERLPPNKTKQNETKKESPILPVIVTY